MGGEHGGSITSSTARSRVVRIKVISMGDMGTGKSCLIKR
jgi:GTPase SAR1 family protein